MMSIGKWDRVQVLNMSFGPQISMSPNLAHLTDINSGLEKLGFIEHKILCSSKQVQENVVHIKILCSFWLYEVHVLT